MIIFYTGTGNSKFAADLIAHDISDEIIDARTYLKEGKTLSVNSERPLVFVSPTYGWRIPRLFEKLIRSSSFTGNKKAYFVMTCGSEVGNAAKMIKKLCEDVGFEFMGLHQAIMPENYIAMFDAPEEKEAAEIITKAVPGLHSAAAKIIEGSALPEINAKAMDKIYTSIVNPFFYDFFVKSKKFIVSDDCIGCGLCEKGCPTNSVKLVNKKPVWSEGCTHCMACICYCPAKAIEYGKISLGKPRYKCPEYNNE